MIAVLGLAGCDDPAAPYVEFNGGGFVANYRNGTTIYGFNVKPMRQLAEGTVLEAVLDDPAGGQPIVLRETVKQPKLRYGFQTPPVRGIVKNKPYKGEIRILEAGDRQTAGELLEVIHLAARRQGSAERGAGARRRLRSDFRTGGDRQATAAVASGAIDGNAGYPGPVVGQRSAAILWL